MRLEAESNLASSAGAERTTTADHNMDIDSDTRTYSSSFSSSSSTATSSAITDHTSYEEEQEYEEKDYDPYDYVPNIIQTHYTLLIKQFFFNDLFLVRNMKQLSLLRRTGVIPTPPMPDSVPGHPGSNADANPETGTQGDEESGEWDTVPKSLRDSEVFRSAMRRGDLQSAKVGAWFVPEPGTDVGPDGREGFACLVGPLWREA